MQTKVAESKNRILAYMNTINNQIFAKTDVYSLQLLKRLEMNYFENPPYTEQISFLATSAKKLHNLLILSISSLCNSFMVKVQ